MLNALVIHHHEENQEAFNTKETNECCQIMIGKNIDRTVKKKSSTKHNHVQEHAVPTHSKQFAGHKEKPKDNSFRINDQTLSLYDAAVWKSCTKEAFSE